MPPCALDQPAIGVAGRRGAGDQEYARNACRCGTVRQDRRCDPGRRVQGDGGQVPRCQRQDGGRSVNNNPGPLASGYR